MESGGSVPPDRRWCRRARRAPRCPRGSPAAGRPAGPPGGGPPPSRFLAEAALFRDRVAGESGDPQPVAGKDPRAVLEVVPAGELLDGNPVPLGNAPDGVARLHDVDAGGDALRGLDLPLAPVRRSVRDRGLARLHLAIEAGLQGRRAAPRDLQVI